MPATVSVSRMLITAVSSVAVALLLAWIYSQFATHDSMLTLTLQVKGLADQVAKVVKNQEDSAKSAYTVDNALADRTLLSTTISTSMNLLSDRQTAQGGRLTEIERKQGEHIVLIATEAEGLRDLSRRVEQLESRAALSWARPDPKPN